MDTRLTKSVKTSKAAKGVVRLPTRPLPPKAIKGLGRLFRDFCHGALDWIVDNRNNAVMSKSKPQPTLTEVLRAAIQTSGLTLYRIGNATKIDPTNLGRFVRGELYIRLDKADRLAAYLGLRLTPDPEAKPPEPTPENLARPMLAKRKATHKRQQKAK